MLRRITGTFAVRASAAAASLLLAAAIINLYSLEKFGEFSLALLSVRTMAAFSLFSLDSLLLRLLLRGDDGLYRLGRRRITRECAGLALVFSLAGTGLILVIACIGMALTQARDFWWSLILLSPLVITQNIALLQASLLRAQRRDAASQILSIGIVAVLPLGVIASAFMARAPIAFLPEIALACASILAAGIGAVLTGLSPLRHVAFALGGMAQGRWRILRYSAAVHSANVMNHLGDWFGAMLLAVTGTFAMTGALRVIQQFGSAFLLVSLSVEIPFSTEIAKAHIARRADQLRAYLLRSQLLLGAVGILLAVAIWAMAGPILQVFDADDPEVRLALTIFAALQAGKFFTGAAASALNLMDATRRLIRASAIALIAIIILQCALVPFFGIVGAAGALGVGVMVRALINLAFVRRELAEMERAAIAAR